MGINSSCQADWCVKPAQLYCDCTQKTYCSKCFTVHMSIKSDHKASSIIQSSTPLIFTSLLYLRSDKTTEVYEGLYKSSPVIIKLQYFTTKSDLNRKQEEAALQRSTKHPNICKCIKSYIDESYTEGFKFVMIMEKAEKDLDDEIMSRVESQNFWTEDEIFHFLNALVDALEFMQRNEMAHRDIKPANILIFGDGNMKLADFGLSIQDDDLGNRDLKVVGTFMYLSPKLMQGYKDIEKGKNVSGCVEHNPFKSDVYSLGLTFLFVASLNQPHGLNFNIEGTTYLHHKLKREINSLKYSEDLKLVLSLMLEVDEEARLDFIELKKMLKREPQVSESFGVSEIPVVESVSEPIQASITIEQILSDNLLPHDIKLALNIAVEDNKLVLCHPILMDEADYIRIIMLEHKLKTLELINCELNSTTLSIILSGNLSGLTTLILGSNNLGRKGARILSEGLKSCTQLQILRIWDTSIGNKGLKYCCPSLSSSISELFLGQNRINNKGAKILSRNIPQNLQILSLCDNQISDEGVRALAVSLNTHKNIRQIYLDRNKICAIGLKYLLSYLPSTLKTLRISGNGISEELGSKIPKGYKIIV